MALLMAVLSVQVSSMRTECGALNPNLSLLHQHVPLTGCCDIGSAWLCSWPSVFTLSFTCVITCHNWRSVKAFLPLRLTWFFCIPVADQRRKRKTQHTLRKKNRLYLKYTALIYTRECSGGTISEICTYSHFLKGNTCPSSETEVVSDILTHYEEELRNTEAKLSFIVHFWYGCRCHLQLWTLSSVISWSWPKRVAQRCVMNLEKQELRAGFYLVDFLSSIY